MKKYNLDTLRLKFEDPELENKFLDEHSKKSVLYYRFSIGLGVIVSLYFSFVDRWSLPIHADYGVKVRLYFMAPVLILLVLSTFHKKFYKFFDYAIVAAALTAVLSIAAIVYVADPSEPAYDSYYAGILLVNVWISSYLKSRFNPALFAVGLNNIIYISLAFFHQNYLTSTDPQRIYILYSNLSFIISTNFISLLGCRETEIYARKEFAQNEMRIDQQAKLVDASRLAALGEMAAGVAHEINNPLSIIVSSVHSIERRIKDNNLEVEHLQSNLNKMTSSSQRIVNIVKSLKIYSRDGKKDELKKENLSHVINDSLFYCKEKFSHSGIALNIESIPNVNIHCKISQISQVIINLLNNSYDSFDDKTTHPEVRVSFKLERNKVIVYIIDNGRGIPNEIREKIMNPFFTTKPAGKGTGLGLSLSKEIIEQHGGELKLHDSEGQTIFSFSLPTI